MAAYHKEAAGKTISPQEWVDAYGNYLFRYACARLRESSAAEEVVQETFLAAIRHLDDFDGSGSQLAWLLGILKRKIIDAIRIRERRVDVEQLDSMDSDSVLFSENGVWVDVSDRAWQTNIEVERREFWQVIRDCLTSISSVQANVFVLSVMEQLSTERVCAELGISRDTMWTRLHRARLSIAKCVSRKLALETGEES